MTGVSKADVKNYRKLAVTGDWCDMQKNFKKTPAIWRVINFDSLSKHWNGCTGNQKCERAAHTWPPHRSAGKRWRPPCHRGDSGAGSSVAVPGHWRSTKGQGVGSHTSETITNTLSLGHRPQRSSTTVTKCTSCVLLRPLRHKHAVLPKEWTPLMNINEHL